MKANIPHNILFFEKSAFMSVELLDILKDGFQVCSFLEDPAYELLKKSNYNIFTYGNTELTKSIDSDLAVNAMLADHAYIKSVVGNNPARYGAIFFYMSMVMDKLFRSTGISLLLPSYLLQEKLGSKINLDEIGKTLNINVNSSVSVDFTVKNDYSSFFDHCQEQFGLPFIVQGELGVSGEDTYLIHSREELVSKIEEKKGKYKANRYLKINYPISVHCCVTDNESHIEGPYMQLVGFAELAKNPFQFSGNDTNQTLLNNNVIRRVNEATERIAEYSRRLGYRGIFGIDFLWDHSTDQIYLQEINSRLVGLTRLLTGIQKEQGITPHLLMHINQFSQLNGIREPKGKINLSKHHYSQLYISHTGVDTAVIRKQIKPGIYSVTDGNLKLVSGSLFTKSVNVGEVLINFAAYVGSVVHTDQVIAKIIIKDTALDMNRYSLSAKVKETIRIIKNEML